MQSYIQPIFGLRVDKALAAALPVPALSTDGVSLAGWKPRAGAGFPLCALHIEADGAATITDPMLFAFGPYGIGGADKWDVVTGLNNGSVITMTAALGFIQQVQLPSAFKALAVGGTVGGGNNVGYTVTPIAVHDA